MRGPITVLARDGSQVVVEEPDPRTRVGVQFMPDHPVLLDRNRRRVVDRARILQHFLSVYGFPGWLVEEHDARGELEVRLADDGSVWVCFLMEGVTEVEGGAALAALCRMTVESVRKGE